MIPATCMFAKKSFVKSGWKWEFPQCPPYSATLLSQNSASPHGCPQFPFVPDMETPCFVPILWTLSNIKGSYSEVVMYPMRSSIALHHSFEVSRRHLIKWLLLSNTRRLVTSRDMWLPGNCDFHGNLTSWEMWQLWKYYFCRKCDFPRNVNSQAWTTASRTETLLAKISKSEMLRDIKQWLE